MEIAILADIHGNHIAFEKCLDYCSKRGINHYIFLGDYLGELPCPEITMQLIYRLQNTADCRFIRGNKENYWIKYLNDGAKGWCDGSSITGSLYYTYHRLSKRDFAFFSSLKTSDRISFDQKHYIEICHVPPYSFSSEDVYALSEKHGFLDGDFLLCAHRHIQGQLTHKGRIVVNPGAVGVPLYSNGETQFAILSGSEGDWSVEYISLPYDTEKLIREMYAEKLDKHAPYWMKVTQQVVRGCNLSHAVFLDKAMALCTQEYGMCNWPNIPENCCAKAYNIVYGE